MRYSYDGIFPNSGEYCDSQIKPQRWSNLRDDLNLSIKPYKKHGDYILVTCQRDMGWSMDGLSVINWLHVLLQDVKRFTDRKILVRFHPGDKKVSKHVQQLRAIGHKVEISSPTSTLLKDLHDAYAVISYNSSPAVVAAIEGVPIFVLDPTRSQSAEVANRHLKDIENPSYDFDREAWLRRLAMMHWRLDELRSGECWRHMKNWVNK